MNHYTYESRLRCMLDPETKAHWDLDDQDRAAIRWALGERAKGGTMSNEPDWKALSEQYARQLRRAEKVIRMAYQKHSYGDASVGWDELDQALSKMLAEFKQDREFQRWSEEQEAKSD